MSAAVELSIRACRAAFNSAIASGNAAAIGPILARDCIMMTGTDSAIITGRNAQVKVWAREFAASDRFSYVRTPGTITPSSVEPIALESGTWLGTAISDGAIAASGVYTAKWRRIGDDWCIEAEIFVTLA